MSQVNSGGATLTNNIAPWNRTPGKPGNGSNSSSSFPSNRWPGNKLNSAADSGTKRDTPLEDRVEKASGNSETSQMWPPPIFDSPRMTDASSGSGGVFTQNSEGVGNTNQWSASPFSGAVGPTSLLGAPGAVPNPSANVWSLHSAPSNPSSMPRAITGQQLHSSAAVSTGAPDADATSRRYISGNSNAWPLGSESELMTDDRSSLPLAFSKMNMNSVTPSSGCFQSISDFPEGQSFSPHVPPPSVTAAKPNESPNDLSTTGQKARKKSSIDSAELDALFTSDPEEAIRTVINTTEPWGVTPVDQSTPWNISELSNDGAAGHSVASNTCSSPSGADGTNGGGRTSNSHNSDSNLFDSQNSASGQHQRRLAPMSNSTMNRDLESNVWPSEPPNGTGIWESHYESLGERTARWQQNVSSNVNPSGFPQPVTNHAGLASGQAPLGSRPPVNQLPPGSENNPMYRSFARPAPGLFPVGHPLTNTGASSGTGLGPRPVLGGPVGTSMHGTSGPNSSRAFPLPNSLGIGPGGTWSYPPGSTTVDNLAMNNKTRWPNVGFNRKQQHTVPHIVPGQGANGLRWPPMSNTPHVPGGWSLNDPRRPNLMPGAWAGSPSGDTGVAPGFFNQPHQIIPPSRVRQHSSLANEFSSIAPPPHGGGPNNQAFRPPHSAFYPTLNSGFPSSSSTSQQRIFLSPQQHSQQLQQQSVIRANAMRQLINLGFPDEEVQAIFSDINTNVERALIDLRDRTCHPGLDDIIKSVANNSFLPMGNMDDGMCSELSRSDQFAGPPGSRPITMRSNQVLPDQQQTQFPKPCAAAENLEISLHMLQQRETQILQTIMQLHSKHQELNQKLNQIRSTNLPFATNPVMQELQLQAIQVAQQIEAQQAQLKHVRSQAGMLKQITVSSNKLTQPPSQQSQLQQSDSTSNSGAFNLLTSASWPLGTPTIGGIQSQQQPVQMGAGVPLNDAAPCSDQMLDTSVIQNQSLKMGTGSFLWEPGPWSGPGARASADTYSTAGTSLAGSVPADRRWSATAFPGRLQFGPSLGDPRWSDLSAGDIAGTSAGVLIPETQSPSDSDEVRQQQIAMGENVLSRSVGSRSWLLAQNISPHVSVGALKVTISTTLTTHAKSIGADKGAPDSQLYTPDFEIHPNMSARWVLIGLSSPSEASAVHDILENSGGGPNGSGGHYGTVKAITPLEALLRLQDIQSLASRIKGFNADAVPTSSNLNSGSQSGSALNFVSSVGDLTGVQSNAGVSETGNGAVGSTENT
ncbi:unnamed protein product [Calicophoron daubneyi]|uniref:UBA domain-containing protein n=1 Tax=Calicophoron daubneyi TaxID=300641 RepID=A0AAV2TVT2_CALDB